MSDEERGSVETKLVRCVRCGCEAQPGAVAALAPAPPPPAGYHAGGRELAAELAGTALLVALSCVLAGSPHSPLERALAGGLVITTLVQSFDHVSGALLNPAVSLAAAVRGRVTWTSAALASAAQLAGAAVAPAAARLLPLDHDAALTLPREDLPPYQAALVEAVLAGCLVLANCGSWDARNRLLPGSWPLRVGLIVSALTIVAAELTGASFNPARSFGPALWAWDFRHHWVYWAGPLGGSLVCSLLYSALWRAPDDAPPRALQPALAF